MTLEELRSKTNRMRAESEYIRELSTYKSLTKKPLTTGEKFINTVSKKVIVPAATDAGKDVLTNLLKKIGNEAVNNYMIDYKKSKSNKKK